MEHDCCFKITEKVISIAKAAINNSFKAFILNLFRDDESLLMVFDFVFEVIERMIGVDKVVISNPF